MTRTIGLADDAYDRLAAVKQGHESFSDVVRRLTGAHLLRNLVGTMPTDVADHYRTAIAEGRERVDAERQDRVRRMLE